MAKSKWRRSPYGHLIYSLISLLTVSVLSIPLLASAKAVLATSFLLPTGTADPTQFSEVASPSASLSELPVTFPVQSAELALYFNRIAHSEDIAAFPEPFFGLLPQVTHGQRMAIFRSWSAAERDLPGMLDWVDLVAYNPEHWEYTPVSEQQDLPATVRRAAEFAKSYDLGFVFVPDRRFAQAHMAEVAPFVDAIILQGQRLQNDPVTYEAWINDMTAVARANNPELQVLAQVSATQGTPGQMFAAIKTVADIVDGISIWSLPRTQTVLAAFVELLPSVGGTTPRATDGPITPTGRTLTRIAPTSSSTPSAEIATDSTPVATMVPSQPAISIVATPTIQPLPPPVIEQELSSSLLDGVTLLAIGGVVSLLLGVAMMRRRDD